MWGVEGKPWPLSRVRCLLNKTSLKKLINSSLWNLSCIETSCEFEIEYILEGAKKIVATSGKKVKKWTLGIERILCNWGKSGAYWVAAVTFPKLSPGGKLLAPITLKDTSRHLRDTCETPGDTDTTITHDDLWSRAYFFSWYRLPLFNERECRSSLTSLAAYWKGCEVFYRFICVR